MKNAYTTVLAEVMEAYYDCWSEEPFEVAMKHRNLDFKASMPVTRDEAHAILSEAIPHGYNEFDADLVIYLPIDCMVTIAREGSVCLYIDRDISASVGHKMMADEVDFDGGETRMWWD